MHNTIEAIIEWNLPQAEKLGLDRQAIQTAWDEDRAAGGGAPVVWG